MLTTDKVISVVVKAGPRLLLAGALVACLPLAMGAPGAGASQPSDPNLLTGDTATLSGSLGSWLGSAATVARPSPGVLSLTATSTGMAGAISGAGGTAVAATADRVYTGAMSVKAAGTVRNVSAVLRFLAQDGTLLATAFGQPVTETTSSWTRTYPAVGLAPLGTAYVAVAEGVGSPAVGEVHYLTSPLLTVAPAVTRTGVAGPLHTSGATIYDANGSPIVLRGVNRRGLEAAKPVAITTDEIAQARRWGANMVRLPLSSSYWLTGNCNYDSGYAAAVDRAVQAVTSQGMVALLDLHTNTMIACAPVKQQRMADSTAPEFWRQVASRYKDNPLVAFDLYNEPHDVSNDLWLNGGKAMSGTMIITISGMQSLYDAVRSTGATNLVVISGLDWASNPPSQLVRGTNIVYGLHDYTCPQSTDPRLCSPNPQDATPVLQRWVNLATTYPLAVTEFGWPNQVDGRFMSSFTTWADAHGWSWAAFGWDGSTSGTFGLVASLATYEPNATGMPVLNALSHAP